MLNCFLTRPSTCRHFPSAATVRPGEGGGNVSTIGGSTAGRGTSWPKEDKVHQTVSEPKNRFDSGNLLLIYLLTYTTSASKLIYCFKHWATSPFPYPKHFCNCKHDLQSDPGPWPTISRTLNTSSECGFVKISFNLCRLGHRNAKNEVSTLVRPLGMQLLTCCNAGTSSHVRS